MTLTNIGLVEFAKQKMGTAYVYGMKGTVMTQQNYNYLQRIYGTEYVWLSDERKVGEICVDCSGLISWYTTVTKSSTQFKTESAPQPIATIADAPIGVAVWRQGHIGIYIGDGEIIEARGSAYGVVQTKVSERDFTHWFYITGIVYSNEEDEEEYVVENITVIVDDVEVEMEGIFVDGTNYVKIRDLANALGVEIGNKGAIPVLSLPKVEGSEV
ncbi:NlpC/P60 family protein [Chakrabartyella piscis]|uniref:NlpC/P60 family protein n=1 Tax=Chakrabartyella piscis TaxID=2918914 RepID=UPI002958CAD1|nr:NlpC/P60 family protein [Chakrabartyella piscis]